MPRYLDQIVTGRRYPWTEALAKRPDMREASGDDPITIPVTPPTVAPDSLGDAPPPAVPMTREALEATHWKTLQAMVTAAGGEYTDKPAAIDFLLSAEQ